MINRQMSCGYFWTIKRSPRIHTFCIRFLIKHFPYITFFRDTKKRTNSFSISDLQFQVVMQETPTKSRESRSIPNSPTKTKKKSKHSSSSSSHTSSSPTKHKNRLFNNTVRDSETEELRNSVKILQAELEEVRTRNIFLTNLVEEQKQ